MSAAISVMMPAYNAERYIGHALRSLLRESALGLEIIVADDGSSDGTVAVAQELADRHSSIRVVPSEHVGIARIRNRALAETDPASRYLAFLDADDHSAPFRLERQLRRLQSAPDVGFVIGVCRYFEFIDEATSVVLPASRTADVTGTVLGSTLFTRSAIERVGPFDEMLGAAEDIDLYLRLLEADVPYLEETEVALLYRRHATNMTNDVALIRRNFAMVLQKSLGRRRRSGKSMTLPDLFKRRRDLEESLRNA